MQHSTPCRKTLRLEIKSFSETGKFAGYASVFDVVDNQQDMILRGAFLDTIHGRESEIKLLWKHQFSEPVGHQPIV